MIFTRAWASHAHREWQISFSPSALQKFRFSVSALDLRKNTAWFTVEKVPFLWPAISPANFGKNIYIYIGHLELVPSSIRPFLIFF